MMMGKRQVVHTTDKNAPPTPTPGKDDPRYEHTGTDNTTYNVHCILRERPQFLVGWFMRKYTEFSHEDLTVISD